jgi:hypothetical protein
LDGGQFSETEKLVPHLGKHEDYVIHYQELQYYVKLGIVVDEVIQILSFNQTNWLVPYIAKNMNLVLRTGQVISGDLIRLT